LNCKVYPNVLSKVYGGMGSALAQSYSRKASIYDNVESKTLRLLVVQII
jgi:hypothetical protein